MKTYRMEIAIKQSSTQESPSCPSYWRGSGCYDVDVYNVLFARCDVSAEDPKQAIDILFRYAANNINYGTTESMKVIKCEEIEDEEYDEACMVEWDDAWLNDPDELWSSSEPDIDAMTEDDVEEAFHYQDERRQLRHIHDERMYRKYCLGEEV